MRGHAIAEGRLPPLALRGLLLVLGTASLVGLSSPAEALGPGLALTIVVAFAAIPLPGTTAKVLQSMAELTGVGLVIGSIGPLAFLFVPLLLLPAFGAGQRGGLTLGGVGGVVAGLAWSLAVLSSTTTSALADSLIQPGLWTVILITTGLIGGWVRRLTTQTQTASDTAYTDAFRLLTELQRVARNLSLGLDPTTLGGGLLDEVGAAVPGSHRSLSVRNGEGRLAPLVGDASPPTDGPAQEHHSFAVSMGEQTVAVLDVHTDSIDPAQLRRIEELVAESGPMLAAALLFDDVRQLATVDERLRLAREIHDGIAQEVASVGYLLDDLAARVPAEDAAEVRSVRDHVRRVVGELRLSIFDLRTGVDDSIGLGTAVSEHVQRIGQQSDLVVHTVLDEHGARLPAGTEVELLRIAQEAVNNVRKHAHAGNMWVEVTVDAPRAWLRVADDGIGLQPARPQAMGLRGMRERAKRIGGDLVVASRPGGGTVVEVSLGGWEGDNET